MIFSNAISLLDNRFYQQNFEFWFAWWFRLCATVVHASKYAHGSCFGVVCCGLVLVYHTWLWSSNNWSTMNDMGKYLTDSSYYKHKMHSNTWCIFWPKSCNCYLTWLVRTIIIEKCAVITLHESYKVCSFKFNLYSNVCPQTHCLCLCANTWTHHYSDVIMGAMPSQITSLTIVYSAVYSGADQRKHQSSASLAFVRGIHRKPANSPHQWPVTRKMFPSDDVIM